VRRTADLVSSGREAEEEGALLAGAGRAGVFLAGLSFPREFARVFVSLGRLRFFSPMTLQAALP
jgi:hypothetical protein